jgi:uracil-DNA glycosylase
MCAVLLPEKGYGAEPDVEIPRLLLSHQVKNDALVQQLHFWKPAALWLVGEKVAQFFLKTTETLAQLRAKQPLSVLLGQKLPLRVIVTEHPRDIADDIAAKRRIYQDLLRLKAQIEKS